MNIDPCLTYADSLLGPHQLEAHLRLRPVRSPCHCLNCGSLGPLCDQSPSKSKTKRKASAQSSGIFATKIFLFSLLPHLQITHHFPAHLTSLSSRHQPLPSTTLLLSLEPHSSSSLTHPHSSSSINYIPLHLYLTYLTSFFSFSYTSPLLHFSSLLYLFFLTFFLYRVYSLTPTVFLFSSLRNTPLLLSPSSLFSYLSLPLLARHSFPAFSFSPSFHFLPSYVYRADSLRVDELVPATIKVPLLYHTYSK